MAKDVDEFIKSCEECLKNNCKKNGKKILIETTYLMEIFATDLLFVDQQTVILTTIDYYNRKAELRNIISKQPKNI